MNWLCLFYILCTSVSSFSQDSIVAGPNNVEFYDDFIDALPTLNYYKTTCDFDLSTMTDKERSDQWPFTPAQNELIGKFVISNEYNAFLCAAKDEDRLLRLFITDENGMNVSTNDFAIEDCGNPIEFKIGSGNTLVYSSFNNGEMVHATFQLTADGTLKKL